MSRVLMGRNLIFKMLEKTNVLKRKFTMVSKEFRKKIGKVKLKSQVQNLSAKTYIIFLFF